MAGPIRISFLADTGPARQGLQDMAASAQAAGDKIESSLDGARQSSQKLDGAFDKASEGADTAEGRFQGLSSTLTGTKDTMAGLGQLASGDVYGGLVSVGQGAADLAEGLNYTVIPMVKLGVQMISNTASTVANSVATKAAAVASRTWAAGQWLLNAALTANPIGLVILAIVALVAIFVVAYKKSATFRAIVGAALNGVLAVAKAVASWFTGSFVPFLSGALSKVTGAFSAVVGWVRKNWPLLLAVLTGPIGIAVLAIVRNWDKIKAGAVAAKDGVVAAFANVITFLRNLPARILSAVGNLGKVLWNAGSSIISGLIDGITSKVNALRDKLSSVTKLIPDWKGPLDKDKRLLTPAGRAIMDGLLGGIGDKVPELRSLLGSVSNQIESGLSASPSVAFAGMPLPGSAAAMSAAGSAFAAYITIDGEQLQGRIDKTVRRNNRELKRTVKAG